MKVYFKTALLLSTFVLLTSAKNQPAVRGSSQDSNGNETMEMDPKQDGPIKPKSGDDNSQGQNPDESDDEDVELMLQTLIDHNSSFVSDDDDRRLAGMNEADLALKSLKNTGLCMDVRGACFREGTEVIMYPCSGAYNQRWDTNRHGNIYMWQTFTPYCNPALDIWVESAKFAWCLSNDYAKVRIYQCRRSRDKHQRWDWDGKWKYLNWMANPEYTMDHKFTDNTVINHKKHGGSNQKWNFYRW